MQSYVYYEFVKLYFLELYLKTFIRIFYAVVVLYLSEVYLFIYQIFIRNIFIKTLSGYISDNFLYIIIYQYNIFEFKLCSL